MAANSLKFPIFAFAAAIPLACVAQQRLDAQSGPATSSIDPAKLAFVRTTDERFQSFQIGMSHLTGGETWKSYDPAKGEGSSPQATDFAAVREARSPTDLANRRLRNLAAALGPFYVRYGGTTTNSVYFQDDGSPPLNAVPSGYQTILTAKAWKGAVEFAKAVDAEIITGFTVSSGVRDQSGAWTPKQADPWLAYTRRIGGTIVAAELYNEPNAPEPGRMPKGQSPEGFANDYAAFEPFIRRVAPDMKLAGPGVATLGVPIPMPSVDGITAEQYLSATPKPRFDIISYHFYGAVAERCAPATSPAGISASQALTEDWLARPDKKFKVTKDLRDRYAPNAPIWLTETGAAACGGTRWQPTFLDTFRFVDTQARLARQGLDVIVTHALISGSNGVLDEKTFLPNADYWPAVLWRKLVGSKVLDMGEGRPGLNLYAHCQHGVVGGVTIIAINLDNAEKRLKIKGKTNIYALTASDLQSKTVQLNGRSLAITGDDQLPDLSGARLSESSVSLAPRSVNFITAPKANNAACTL